MKRRRVLQRRAERHSYSTGAALQGFEKWFLDVYIPNPISHKVSE